MIIIISLFYFIIYVRINSEKCLNSVSFILYYAYLCIIYDVVLTIETYT